MIVQITGDRNWKDREYIFNVLDDIHALYGVSRVRCGCAAGADRIAGWPCPPQKRWPTGATEPPLGWAASRGVPVDHFPADWDRYGKAAGPIRNIQMLEGKKEPCEACQLLNTKCYCEPDYPNVVLAFHPTLNTSKGTGHMVKAAQKAGLKVFTFPSIEVPMDFDFKESVLFSDGIVHTGQAPNAEDLKLW